LKNDFNYDTIDLEIYNQRSLYQMNYKKIIRLVSFILALLATLTLASCSDEGGEMTDQSSVSKSGQDNTIKDNEDAAFTREYYNWIYSSAFSGFSSAIKVTKLPADLESALSSLTEEKKISQLRNIFCSTELVSAIQTASELEAKKEKYTHDVVSASKVSKGIYEINLRFKVGNESVEKKFELMLSEKTKGVKLTAYDNNGYELSVHEIVVTNDGYVAVNKCAKSADAWTSIQLMFKGGTAPSGYCAIVSNLKEVPTSIYSGSVYAGFAGKQ
jgi:hypothetical protein